MIGLVRRLFVLLGAVMFLSAPPHAAIRASAASPGVEMESQSAGAAQSAAQRLVGAWQLTSRTVRRADGSTIADPVLGDRPLGRLFYDASGVMMLQMMRPGRSAAIGSPVDPRDAANPRIVLGYDAYFGRYTVDERAGTITHHVEGSLFPEDLGDDWVRPFTLAGDTLTLRFTSSPADGEITRTLIFTRAR